MPNKQAAIKDLRKARKRATYNARVRKNVKVLFKGTRELIIAGKKDEATAKLRAYQQAADKAAKRGVIHANAARRKKSAMMKLLAKHASEKTRAS